MNISVPMIEKRPLKITVSTTKMKENDRYLLVVVCHEKSIETTNVYI